MNLFTEDDKPKKKSYPRKAPENLTWATTFDYMVALPINEYVDGLRNLTRGQVYLSTVDPKRVEFHISDKNRIADVWAVGVIAELNDYTLHVSGELGVNKYDLMLCVYASIIGCILTMVAVKTKSWAEAFCILIFASILFPIAAFVNIQWSRSKLKHRIERAALSEILPAKPLNIPEMVNTPIEQHKKRRV